MVSVTANPVKRGPEVSTFNPTMTLHRTIFRYIRALSTPFTTQHSFLTINIHDSDFTSKTKTRMTDRPQLWACILQQLKEIFNAVDPYVQSFASLKACAESTKERNNYRVVIHEDICHYSEHVREYNGPKFPNLLQQSLSLRTESPEDAVLSSVEERNFLVRAMKSLTWYRLLIDLMILSVMFFF